MMQGIKITQKPFNIVFFEYILNGGFKSENPKC